MERAFNLCNFMLRCPESVLFGVCAFLFRGFSWDFPCGVLQKLTKKVNLVFLTCFSETSDNSLKREQKLDFL